MKDKILNVITKNKIIRSIFEITKEIISECMWFAAQNANYIMNALKISVPFFAMFATIRIDDFNLALLAVITYSTMIFYADAVMKKMDIYSDDIPVPSHRFTHDDGHNISCKQEEANEIVLYLCDLENYLQRKGKL